MQETPEIEPANLRLLRRLVTTLMIVMIVGLVVLIVLFVIRLQPQSALTFPNDISLPKGTVAVGYTQTPDWVVIVTQNDTVLIFDRDTLTLSQTIVLNN
jgi:hypothetical protein